MHSSYIATDGNDSALSGKQYAFAVTESSHVEVVRRAAVDLAQQAKFIETAIGHVSVVVTELATNLVRHATAGLILLRPCPTSPTRSVEILALDHGPGMANVSACIRDGYSTDGSADDGLGAVLRLSSICDIYSIPQRGTVIYARLVSPPQEYAPSDSSGAINDSASITPLSLPHQYTLDYGVVNLPLVGEVQCGDGWALRQHENSIWLMVVDGLGHGPGAAEAAGAAMEVFLQLPLSAPTRCIEAMHTALYGTRGAAVAVVEVDLSTPRLVFAGIGNIAGTVRTATGWHGLMSHNGIVGHQMRYIQEISLSLDMPTLLVMHSDGLKSQWDLGMYPGLVSRSAGVIAGVLYRDQVRKRDDATVVAMKISLA